MQTSEIVRRIRSFRARFGATHRAAPAILIGEQSYGPPGKRYDTIQDVYVHRCTECGDIDIEDSLEVMRGIGPNVMETICAVPLGRDMTAEEMEGRMDDARTLAELFDCLDQVEKVLCERG